MAKKSIVPLVGRVLLAAIFLMSVFGKITGFDGTAGWMASSGAGEMAALLLVAAIVLEVFGGFAVLLGYKAKWGAWALILFTVVATLWFHTDFSGEGGQTQMLMFMKNLAIIGGLMFVAHYGPGPYSLEKSK